MAIESIPGLIKQLYSIVDQLEKEFQGRKFTPDGHLVGSIGEVLSAYYYGIDLYSNSYEKHDGVAPCGKLVQVKATQGDRVALRSEPEYLLVLKIEKDGSFREIFNGPGKLVWPYVSRKQSSNGQHTISVSRLKSIMTTMNESDKLERIK